MGAPGLTGNAGVNGAGRDGSGLGTGKGAGKGDDKEAAPINAAEFGGNAAGSDPV
jgi:hypothetical protein